MMAASGKENDEFHDQLGKFYAVILYKSHIVVMGEFYGQIGQKK